MNGFITQWKESITRVAGKSSKGSNKLKATVVSKVTLAQSLIVN